MKATISLTNITLFLCTSVTITYCSVMAYHWYIESIKRDDDEVDVEQLKHEAVSDSTPLKNTNSKEGLQQDANDKAVLKEKAKQLATKGTRLFKEKKYKEAIESYTQGLAIYMKLEEEKDDMKVTYCNRAVAHEKLKQYDDVIADTNEALKIDKKYVKAYKRRGKAQFALGQEMDALTDYATILMIEDSRGNSLADIAKEYENIRNSMLSKKIVTIMESKNAAPKKLHPYSFINSYLSSFYEGESETPVEIETVESLSKQIQLMKDGDLDEKACLLFRRGLASKAQKKYNAASIDFEEACHTMSKSCDMYASCHLENGTFYHLKGDFSKAKDEYELVVEKNPQSLIACVRLAGVHFDLREQDRCIAWFDRAFEINPNSPTALYHRGQIYLIMGSIESSLNDFNACIEHAPDFALAYIQAGAALSKTADGKEKMLEKCLKAVELSCDIPEVYDSAGEAYLHHENVSKAIEMFEKAIEIDPSYPMAYVHRGMVSILLGNLDDAIEWMSKAIHICPECTQAHAQLGDLYAQKGDLKTASEQLEKGIEHALREEEVQDLLLLHTNIKVQHKAFEFMTAP